MVTARRALRRQDIYHLTYRSLHYNMPSSLDTFCLFITTEGIRHSLGAFPVVTKEDRIHRPPYPHSPQAIKSEPILDLHGALQPSFVLSSASIQFLSISHCARWLRVVLPPNPLRWHPTRDPIPGIQRQASCKSFQC